MTVLSQEKIPFSDLPEGTVTFLFSDIEGSTQLLSQLKENYASVLADYRAILLEAFGKWRGQVVDTQGDALFVAFARACEAVNGAVEAQRRLWQHPWPGGVNLKVRMGLHTGEPWKGEIGYTGMAVHRAARLAQAGYGGQVLLSETTTALVLDELPSGVSCQDLGSYQLKDMPRSEHVHQLLIAGLPSQFPALSAAVAVSGSAIENRDDKAPKGLSDEAIIGLKQQASGLVQQLAGAEGSQEMALMDELGSVGLPAQRKAGGELELLRNQIGDMMVHRDISSGITRDLVDLRLALNEINPQTVSRQDWLHRMFYAVPFLRHVPTARRVLEMIAMRYETVSRQVQVIEIRLGEGRRMLARDNVELRKLYEQIETQLPAVQQGAYFGELIMHELDRIIPSSIDPIKRAHLESTLHDVAMRVQDLHAMEEVFVQFFISIDLTRQNNNRLGQSVERTLSLATNIVVIGLAIQTALSRQKRVLEATQKTREFLGEMIVSNASAIRRQTEEIGDVYNNPSIALDKLVEAHQELVEALNTVEGLQREGTENARQNIARLTELSAELHQKALAVHKPSDRPDHEIQV